MISIIDQIDNVGDYFYLKDGSFKIKVDPHQFNMRLHQFLLFLFNLKKPHKLAGLWLAGEVVNHVGIHKI